MLKTQTIYSSPSAESPGALAKLLRPLNARDELPVLGAAMVPWRAAGDREVHGAVEAGPEGSGVPTHGIHGSVAWGL